MIGYKKINVPADVTAMLAVLVLAVPSQATSTPPETSSSHSRRIESQCTNTHSISPHCEDPTHALTRAPPHTCKEALPVASNSRLAILHTTEQATELCDELQCP